MINMRVPFHCKKNGSKLVIFFFFLVSKKIECYVIGGLNRWIVMLI